MVFTWWKVIFEISQEVETSSPEVENGIYLVIIEISQEWKRVPGSGTWYLPGRR